MSDDVKKVLRALKVGDPCIVVTTGYRTNGPETRALTTVTSVGRRWMSVALDTTQRFDRDDGLNDSAGNYRYTPRVSTQALLDAQARHEAASKKVRDALMTHGWWSGDKLGTEKLERILAVLEEPDEPVP
jgi:hypothetical protein